ncbi:cytochrome P450 4g15-like [Fopius arisanus]|uniref:Cytochrome P450 4g15-like n=1 Tax=Fopius arisanus TaxID=64838 RepID=A0A9R1SYI8_9HYME|nr:PREDICTED: cytochrome P450 4g15-like [Fopius arisanus]
MRWTFLTTGSGISMLNSLWMAYLLGTIAVLWVIRYRKEIQEYIIFRKEILKCSASLRGPPGIPLVGNAHQFADTGKTIFTLAKMSQDINVGTFKIWLGPIMKVIVTDPRDFEIIMGSAKAAEKDTVYDFMKPAVINSLINGGGPVYRAHKKLVVPLINGGNLITEHIKQFNYQTKIMIKKMADKVGTGEFDVHHAIVPCVADIVFETMFGVPGKAQNGEHNILVEGTETYSKGRHPWAFLPFSGGLRSCPGSKYGMICIKVIIAQMVRHYQLETTLKYETLNIHAHISTRSIDGYPISLKKIN